MSLQTRTLKEEESNPALFRTTTIAFLVGYFDLSQQIIHVCKEANLLTVSDIGRKWKDSPEWFERAFSSIIITKEQIHELAKALTLAEQFALGR